MDSDNYFFSDQGPSASYDSSGFCVHKVTPDTVVEFVREIVQQTQTDNLYIPFATEKEISKFNPLVNTFHYTTYDEKTKKIIEEHTNVESVTEDVVNSSAYDLVYSEKLSAFPKRHKYEIESIGKSISRLSSKGYGVFTFGYGIIHNNLWNKAIDDFNQNGFWLSAVIDLPEGLFKPYTDISTKIVIVSRECSEKVFLAKLKKDADIPSIVRFFLTKTNSGKSEALGKWFDRDGYSDFSSYENELRRKRIASKLEKNYQGKMMPISEISSAVLSPKKSEENPFVEAENAIYIPKLGNSNVVGSISEFNIKSQNYFQILVDQSIVLPGFLKFFFNTDKGLEIRVRASEGYIPSLSVERIKKIEVPIPSLDMQSSVLEVYADLNEIELEAKQLKTKLMDIPVAYSSIAKEIKEINNKGDRFEQWMESLPYPLATILKRYSAADTYQDKQTMLFFFFEAYSIFIAALLTAVYQQPQYRDLQVEDVSVDYFEKASFGSWIKMDKSLSKIFRKQLGDPQTIDIVLNSFHTDDQSLVLLLCRSEVFSVLDKACTDRNNWKGHSGIANEQIYKEHVRLLEEKLLELQEHLKDLFEKIQLIRPYKLSKKHGEFINKIELLTGSNSIFKKDEVVGDALDEELLYIRVVDTGEVFEIPPFFLLKNSPSDVKNACYFYSRIDGSNSRYVSYHFEGQPEDLEKGEAAFGIIKSVLGSDN